MDSGVSSSGEKGTIVDGGGAKEQSSFFGKVKSWFGSSTAQNKEKTNDEILKDTLVECGFKLIEANQEIFINFLRSDVDVEYMTSDSVLSFFASFDSETPMCELGSLPRHLSETPFENEKALTIVLDYCMKSTAFERSIHGLPLLLTADSYLDRFANDRPVFRSEYCDLLSGAGGRFFLKNSMLSSSFANYRPSDMTTVFKHFTVADLAELLPNALPVETFKSVPGGCVEWTKNGTCAVPTKAWLKQLWRFLREAVEAKKLQETAVTTVELQSVVTTVLEPVVDWCLIPATSSAQRSGGSFLYAIDSGDRIFDSRVLDLDIRSVIQKLVFPQLDADCIGTLNHDVIRCLITTYDKPTNVLRLMHQRFTPSPDPGDGFEDVADLPNAGHLKKRDYEVCRFLTIVFRYLFSFFYTLLSKLNNTDEELSQVILNYTNKKLSRVI